MRLAPPNQRTVELVAAWAETKCRPWSACNKLVDDHHHHNTSSISPFKGMPESFVLNFPGFARLVRVSNGTLTYDWPFPGSSSDLSVVTQSPPHHTKILQFVLLKLGRNLGDSVFLLADEIGLSPQSFPFPTVSNAPGHRSSDIPFTYPTIFNSEMEKYRRVFLDKAGVSYEHEYYKHQSLSFLDWEKRVTKAAFYGTMSVSRHVFFDAANSRPDLFDVGWLGTFESLAWNPLSREETLGNEDELREAMKRASSASSEDTKSFTGESGFYKSIFHLHVTKGNQFLERKYKYLVVLVGAVERSGDRSSVWSVDGSASERLVSLFI